MWLTIKQRRQGQWLGDQHRESQVSEPSAAVRVPVLSHDVMYV